MFSSGHRERARALAVPSRVPTCRRRRRFSALVERSIGRYISQVTPQTQDRSAGLDHTLEQPAQIMSGLVVRARAGSEPNTAPTRSAKVIAETEPWSSRPP
jgi:hypothetical protein